MDTLRQPDWHKQPLGLTGTGLPESFGARKPSPLRPATSLVCGGLITVVMASSALAVVSDSHAVSYDASCHHGQSTPEAAMPASRGAACEEEPVS